MDDFLRLCRPAATAAALVLLAACATDLTASLAPDQTRELNFFVSAYHYCVAHTAARIDDGRAPVGDVAATAMLHCQPEARDVVGYLGAIKVPEDLTQRYLQNLLTTAARNSALMLLRQRSPEPVTHQV